ncbi:MAG: TetR/AcrR family transcriptional regulator [Chloroflexota bacterium]
MEHSKNDRRSKRTRQSLGDALVELMLEKRFDDITVQDILDRANIGRSTFYTHYTDKEQLLLGEIERMIHQLDAYMVASGHPYNGLLPSSELFRHVQQQRRLMQAFMWGQGAEMLMRGFQGQVSKIVAQNLLSMSDNKTNFSVPLPVVANFVASTFLMLMRWWIENDMQQTPEQMDAMFQKLVMPGVQGITG